MLRAVAVRSNVLLSFFAGSALAQSASSCSSPPSPRRRAALTPVEQFSLREAPRREPRHEARSAADPGSSSSRPRSSSTWYDRRLRQPEYPFADPPLCNLWWGANIPAEGRLPERCARLEHAGSSRCASPRVDASSGTGWWCGPGSSWCPSASTTVPLP